MMRVVVAAIVYAGLPRGDGAGAGKGGNHAI